MSVNTKAFIKAIRPAVVESGVVTDVKRALTSRFGLQFQESVYRDGRYRKQFKLAPGYPATLNTEQIRAAASGIPGGYGNLRRAVENAVNGAASTTTASGDGVNTDEFIALVKQYADRYEWCSSAEEAVENAFEGLEFDDDRDLVLVGTYPQTLNREDVQQFVNDARTDYSNTTGVNDLLNEITERWLNGTQASTNQAQNARPAPSRNGQYRVTIDTTLNTEQLRHLGWNGSSSLTGLPVRYNGINGRITTASNA